MFFASARSTLLEKSTNSPASARDDETGHVFADFGDFITNSCKIFDCPVPIAFNKEFYLPEKLKVLKSYKVKFKRLQHISIDQSSDTSEDTTSYQTSIGGWSVEDSILTISTTYDNLNRLTDILITKYHYQPVPRILIKVMALIISNYKQLTRFTIKNCRVDKYTIYELSKLLPISVITEVCLDGCPLGEANYDTLLLNSSCLKHLSLCRCKINDEVCQRIASKLYFSEPAEEHMTALDLASNHITDLGAKHLADALRSNRHLRYLNLTDNLLSDEGAHHIFNVLVEFPLTYDEIIGMRHRYMLYLKMKRALYFDCLLKIGQMSIRSNTELNNKKHLSLASKRSSIATSTTKHKSSITKDRKQSSLSVDNTTLKAENMVKELLGPFLDPFNSSSLTVNNERSCCIGNFTLCYLSIAYNNLTYMSIKKLLSVVEYQESLKKTIGMCGLVRITLDGNYIPANCLELSSVNHILSKYITTCGKETIKSYSARKSILK